MKNFLIVFLSVVVLLFFSCAEEKSPTESDDPQGAIALVDSANKALETVLYDLVNNDSIDNPDDINFTVPYSLYNQAYAKDPANLDANFGLALTNILMLTQDQMIKDTFDEWDLYLKNNNPFEAPLAGSKKKRFQVGFPKSIYAFNIPTDDLIRTVIGTQKMALKNTPKLSSIQNIFENVLLPKLNFAITALDLVDNNSSYIFTITPRMQGDEFEDPLEVDLTEIYAMEVALNVLRAMVDIAISYNVDFTGYDSLGVYNAFQPGSNFMTVRNSGAYLSQAKSSLLTAVNKLETGIGFLRNETDSQNNDIIKLGPNDVNDADLDSILAHTDDVRSILTTGYTFHEDWDDDYMTPDEDLTINLGNFFDNPIQDFKSLFPQYTCTVGRDTIDSDYWWWWENALINATINVDVSGYYKYIRTYGWDKWGWQYNYTDTTISIPEFASAFNNKINELHQMQNLSYFYVSIYMYSSYLTQGQHQISEYLYWEYENEIPVTAIYVPVITWNANSFQEWILPNPTVNGILPGMTDTEFKRIFGMTADDWQKSFRMEFD